MYVATAPFVPLYSHELVGPVIKPGVDGLLRVMLKLLPFADVPQSFVVYTDIDPVANVLLNVSNTVVSYSPGEGCVICVPAGIVHT